MTDSSTKQTDTDQLTELGSDRKDSWLKRGFNQLRAVFVFLLMILNTVFWCIPIYILAIFKLILPITVIRRGIQSGLMFCASNWISGNELLWRLYRSMHWKLLSCPELDPKASYLVNCNHQSWVDIFVLQSMLNRRVPFMRFFIKQQLIWVPFIGLAWWALDFPFMRRYCREQLEHDPGLRTRDLETTQKVCERLSSIPLSIMNFVEGTRFTPAKHARQESPHQHLLKPKIGGLSVALCTLKEQMQLLLDITIVYPDGRPTLWSLFRGQLHEVLVDIRQIRIPDNLLGQDRQDPEYRKALQDFINQIWIDKDMMIDKLTRDELATRQSS